jgi:hypothetical protein
MHEVHRTDLALVVVFVNAGLSLAVVTEVTIQKFRRATSLLTRSCIQNCPWFSPNKGDGLYFFSETFKKLVPACEILPVHLRVRAIQCVCISREGPVVTYYATYCCMKIDDRFQSGKCILKGATGISKSVVA